MIERKEFNKGYVFRSLIHEPKMIMFSKLKRLGENSYGALMNENDKIWCSDEKL